jgi:omega-6 fatty acid desaturase (delta-12 desaturase)
MNHPSQLDARQVFRDISVFAQPIVARSIFELAITTAAFTLLWAATWAAVANGYWLGWLLTIPAGGLLLRLFIIQHDCGHGSLFRRRSTNDWVGRALSVLTLTPYDSWRKAHAKHHATSGNLEKRGTGDIDTLTVAEYRALSMPRRWLYRLYRSPLVLFVVGPAFTFLFRHRFPIGENGGWRVWVPTLATNAAIISVAALLVWKIGLAAFLSVHLPIVLVAATAGIWLFYVQHQFEHTSWDHDSDWSFHDAALHGSSYYQLPAVLRWFTGNIGIHHVHHLSCRIPFYRLRDVLEAHPALSTINRLGVRESIAATRLTLWDQDKRRLLSFGEAG